jgi:NADPH:quinone reductase-like Zn-dependent oxidoreductase
MKAIRIHEFGGPEVVKLEEVAGRVIKVGGEVPDFKAGDIPDSLSAVQAAALPVNYLTALHCGRSSARRSRSTGSRRPTTISAAGGHAGKSSSCRED